MRNLNLFLFSTLLIFFVACDDDDKIDPCNYETDSFSKYVDVFCDDKSNCFDGALVTDFRITQIDDQPAITSIPSEITCDCESLSKSVLPCRVDVSGRSTGLIEQNCTFIYFFVKSTVDQHWWRQEISTSINFNDGSFTANLQLGDLDTPNNYPCQQRFEILAIATACDLFCSPLNFYNPKTNLPADYIVTDIMTIEVEQD